jgi:hypothetical protein
MCIQKKRGFCLIPLRVDSPGTAISYSCVNLGAQLLRRKWMHYAGAKPQRGRRIVLNIDSIIITRPGSAGSKNDKFGFVFHLPSACVPAGFSV